MSQGAGKIPTSQGGNRTWAAGPIPTTYFPALNRCVPESAQNHAVIRDIPS